MSTATAASEIAPPPHPRDELKSLALEADQFYASDDWKNADAPKRQKYLDRTAEVFDEAFKSAESSLDEAEADSFYNSTTAFLQGKMAEHNKRVTGADAVGVLGQSFGVAQGMAQQTIGSGVMRAGGTKESPAVEVQPLDWSFELPSEDALKAADALRQTRNDANAPEPNAEDYGTYGLQAIQLKRSSAQERYPKELLDFIKKTGLRPEHVYRLMDDREALERLKDKAVVMKTTGEVAVPPQKAMDEVEWNSAVDATDATPEKKAKAKAHRLKVRDQLAGKIEFSLAAVDPKWEKWSAEMAGEMKDASVGEKVERFIKWRKASGAKMSAIDRAVDQNAASFVKQFFGLIGGITNIGMMKEAAATAGEIEQANAQIRSVFGGAGAAGFAVDLFGGLAPTIAFSPLARLATTNLGAMRLMFTVGAAGSYGGKYADASAAYREQGFSDRDAHMKAQLPALVSAATTYILANMMPRGVESIARIGRAKDALKTATRKWGGELFADIKDETFEEIWQGISDEITAKFTYDPSKDMKTAVSNVVYGGIMGAVGGGVVGAVSRYANKVKPILETAEQMRKDGYPLAAAETEKTAEIEATKQYWADVAKAQKRAVERAQSDAGLVSAEGAKDAKTPLYDAFGNVQRKAGGFLGLPDAGNPEGTPKAQATPVYVEAKGDEVQDKSLKGTKYESQQMSPDAYIKETGGYSATTINQKKVDALKEKILSGVPLDPPTLDYNEYGDVSAQEGRHRAEAAKQLGIKRIPVVMRGAAVDANYKPEPAKESEPKNEKAQSVPSVQKADESVRLPQKEVTPAAPSPEPVTPAAAKPVAQLSASDESLVSQATQMVKDESSKHGNFTPSWVRGRLALDSQDHATLIFKALVERGVIQRPDWMKTPVAPEPVEKPSQPAAAPAAEQPAPAPIEQVIADANWRGTVREVPAPRSMGGEGVKLYIPVDASGKDVSVGGQTILGKTPAEAIELAQKNAKPAPAPVAALAKGRAETVETLADSHGADWIYKNGNITKPGFNAKWTPEEKSAMEQRFKAAGFRIGRMNNSTGETLKNSFKIDSESKAKLDTVLDQREMAAKQAKKDADAQKKKDADAATLAATDQSALAWLNKTFGEQFANAFNKASLADFISGKESKFKGLPQPQWERGLRVIGALDGNTINYAKIKESYEQNNQAAANRPAKGAGQEVVQDEKAPQASKAGASSNVAPQSEGGIFGYAWADIRSKQQGGKLAALIRGNAPKATESDFAVLEKHGMDWLYDNEKGSIIERLGLPVDKPSKKAEAKAPVSEKAKQTKGVTLKVQNPYSLAPENEKILTMKGDIIKLAAQPEHEFFIYKAPNSNYWRVVERKTGSGIGAEMQKTRAAAIESAEQSVAKVAPDEFTKILNDAEWRNTEKPSEKPETKPPAPVSEAAKPETPAPKTFKRKARELPPAPGGGEDVIDYIINNIGKLRSRGTAFDIQMKQRGQITRDADGTNFFKLVSKRIGGEYDGLNLPPRLHAAIIAKRGLGVSLDEAAQMLFDAHMIRDAKADTMHSAIHGAYEARLMNENEGRVMQEMENDAQQQSKDFAEDSAKKKKGTTRINVLDLSIGDVVEVNGEKLTVIATDGFDVTLEDGEKYGIQDVDVDAVIYGKLTEGGDAAPEKAVKPVTKETPEPVAPKLRPSDGKGTGELLQGDAAPFNLVAETAADIAKREAREAAEQVAKEAKDAAEAKAKQDKEQGNLFSDDPFTIADTAPATSLPVESVQRAVRVVAGRLAGAMPHEVIADGSQYPQRVKDAMHELMAFQKWKDSSFSERAALLKAAGQKDFHKGKSSRKLSGNKRSKLISEWKKGTQSEKAVIQRELGLSYNQSRLGFYDLPDHAQRALIRKHPRPAVSDLNRIRGVVVSGEIYINAASIEHARQAIETFMHEAAGHGGVDALLKAFGEKATTQLDAMLKRLFPDDYAAVQRSYEPSKQVSETLARLMQRVGPEMSAQARTRWQRVMDWLRNALNNLGVKRWSTNDVMALLRRGVDAVRKSAVAKKPTNVSALVGNELTYAAREAGVALTPEQTMRVVNRDPATTADVQARVSDARGEGAKMSVDEPRITPEQDREYLAAVKRGDTETAQRMVDEAAKVADYKVGPLWHGGAKVTSYQTPLFLSPYEKVSESYRRNRAFDGVETATQRMFAKAKNPAGDADVLAVAKRLRLEGSIGEDSPPHEFLSPSIIGEDKVKAVISELKKQGFDSAHTDGDYSMDDSFSEYDSWTIFDPSQVKSADPITRDADGRVIPLSERFNPESSDIRFSLKDEDRAAPFYSHLTRTVQNLPQLQMTVQQARAAIERGAKKDEIAMSGILTDPLSPLAGKQPGDKVTKAELTGYALERQATVQDVVLGGGEAEMAAKAKESAWRTFRREQAFANELSGRVTNGAIARGYTQLEAANLTSKLDDGRVTVEELPKELRADASGYLAQLEKFLQAKFELENVQDAPGSPTHFSQYQLPGADEGSYREMFVTWPKTQPEKPKHVTFADVERKDPSLARDLDEELYAYASRTMTDRERDIETNNALYDNRNISEELAARLKAAFPDYEKQVERFHATLGKNWNDGHSQYSDIANPIVRIRRNIRTDADGKRTYFIEEMQGPGKGEQEKMPPELRKRIYEIGMKRALRDAVDEGADAIAWTTGEQQVTRYEDSIVEHVDSIKAEAVAEADGVQFVDIRTKDGKTINLEVENGKVREGELSGKSLDEVVGKEMAEKIVAIPKGETRNFTGLDLKVGGEGLKRVYDQMLPAIANDLAKKFGVKVGTAEISSPNDLKVKSVEDGYFDVVRPDGEVLESFGNREDANFFANTQGATSVHSLPIPEALKTQQRGGNVLFSLKDENPEAPSPGAPSDVLPSGDPAWNWDRTIDPWAKRVIHGGRFIWEGTADVMRRAGFTKLADAVETQYDVMQREFGRAWKPLHDALESMSRKEQNVAKDEWSQYFRHKESGRADEAAATYDAASTGGKAIIDGWKAVAEATGLHMRKVGVEVRDGDTWRPIGLLGQGFFPRKISRDVMKVISDPVNNPVEWARLVADLIANGNIAEASEAEPYLRKNVYHDESKYDHFANIEKARNVKLPESWLDYSFNDVAPWYVTHYARRIGQIEAYGQAHKDGGDLFDKELATVPTTKNYEFTREYLESAKETAYWTRPNTTGSRVLRNMQTVATAQFLSSPYSALRNVVSGIIQTVVQYGPLRTMQAAFTAMTSSAARMDAHDRGIIRRDIMHMMMEGRDDLAVSKALMAVTSAGLTVTGFNYAETINRTASMLAAQNFARWAAREISNDPDGAGALQSKAFLVRHGIDPDEFAKENGAGPLTDKFVRNSVRQGQGGYNMDQIPLWQTKPAAAFLTQFGRWGAMMARFVVKHAINPAVFGTKVKLSDGTTTTVRTMRPLLYALASAIGGGELLWWLREKLTGRGRNDDSLEKIGKDIKAGKFGSLLSRVFNDITMAGTLGIIGDYANSFVEFTARGRYKDPFNPPGIQWAKGLFESAVMLKQQGKLSFDDMRDLMEKQFPGVKFTKAAVEHLTGDKSRAAVNAKSAAYSAGIRMAKEQGLPVIAPFNMAIPVRTPNTPFYRDLTDALMVGDAAKARTLWREHLKSTPREERNRLLTGMKTSISQHQPISVGGIEGKSKTLAFFRWAKKSVPKEDYERFKALHKTYWKTAEKAGLISENPYE